MNVAGKKNKVNVYNVEDNVNCVKEKSSRISEKKKNYVGSNSQRKFCETDET